MISHVVPAAETTGSPRNGQQAASPGPSISVPVTRFDFGTVVDGSEVVHEFLIRNTGKALLRVIQINTG